MNLKIPNNMNTYILKLKSGDKVVKGCNLKTAIESTGMIVVNMNQDNPSRPNGKYSIEAAKQDVGIISFEAIWLDK